ncbi:MAG: roadblock/LC7 domain-containing protein [Candidatus Thorarchaeota archaeon]
MEPTTEILDDILKKLLASIPEAKVAAIVSKEGFPIASTLPRGINETKIASMTAALHALAKHVFIASRKDNYEKLIIKGSNGYLLVRGVSSKAVLIVSSTKEAIRLELIFLDLGRWNKSDADGV